MGSTRRHVVWVVVCLALVASCGRLGYDALPNNGELSDAAEGPNGPPEPGDDGNREDVDARPVDATVDAGVPDAFVCPAICTQGCTPAGVCRISGDELDSRQEAIVCPPGFPCEITCTAAGACRTRIDCSQGRSCQVRCFGAGSCALGAVCGSQLCSVHCAADDSCGPIDCAQASACSVSCDGDRSCNDGYRCCGGGTCSVACQGTPSCQSDIQCDSDPDCNSACE